MLLPCLPVCGYMETKCPDGRCVSAGTVCECEDFKKLCDGACIGYWDRCMSDPCPTGEFKVNKEDHFFLLFFAFSQIILCRVGT